MAFKVFVQPTLLAKVSMERKGHIKSAIKELTNPFPDNYEGKKELNGTQIFIYRLRVGDYRVFYQIDEEERKVYIFDILTTEQVH